jgi:hypothetical protein
LKNQQNVLTVFLAVFPQIKIDGVLNSLSFQGIFNGRYPTKNKNPQFRDCGFFLASLKVLSRLVF